MGKSKPAGLVGGKFVGKKSVCHNAGIWARPAAIREEGRKGIFGVYLPVCSECLKVCRTYDLESRPAYKQKKGFFRKLLLWIRGKS